MIELETLISKIKKVLATGILTRSATLEGLAREYGEACQQFIALVMECRSCQEQRKDMEAMQVAAGARPSLPRQYELLNFEGRADFLELYVMYGWQEPPDFPDDIAGMLDELQRREADYANVAALRAVLRQVARLGTREQRLLLMRRIAKVDQSMTEAVKELELEVFRELADKGKKAIEEGDFSSLEVLARELGSPEWLQRTHDMELVLNKMNHELREHRRRVFTEKLRECLNHINDAYGANDYSALESSLNEWRLLNTEAEFGPSDIMQKQFDEAAEYYAREKQAREKQELFERLNRQLSQALNGANTPVGVVEELHLKLCGTGLKISPALEMHYQEFRQSHEAIRRHRIQLKIGAIAVVLAVLLYGIGIVVYRHVQDSKEKRWAEAVRKCLKEDDPDGALRILKELQRRSPAIAGRAAIIRLSEVTAKLKAEHERLRAEFDRRHAELSEKLSRYLENRGEIKVGLDALKGMAIGLDKKRSYEQLVHECDIQERRYVQEAIASYLEILSRFKQGAVEFQKTIEARNALEGEQKLELMKRLRAEADRIADVPADVIAANAETLDVLGELETELAALREKLGEEEVAEHRRRQLLAQLKTPRSLDELVDKLAQLLENYPTAPEHASWKRLHQQAAGALPFLAGNESMEASGALRDARKTLAEFESFETDGLMKLTDKYREVHEDYIREPVYAVVIRDASGNMKTFYMRGADVVRAQDKTLALWKRYLGKEFQEGCEIGVMMDLSMVSGLQKAVVLVPAGGPAHRVTVALQNRLADKRWESYDGELVYPEWDELFQPGQHALKRKAPFIELVQYYLDELKTSRSLEMKILSMLRKTSCDEALHPFFKYTFMEELLAFMAEKSPIAARYKSIYEAFCGDIGGVFRDYQWIRSFRETGGMRERLQQELNLQYSKIEARLKPVGEFRKQVLREALNRRLMPLAYTLPDGEETELVKFPGVQEKGEIWEWRGNAERPAVVGTYEKTELRLSADTAALKPYTILLAPADGRDTRKLTAELQAEGEQCGESLNCDIWPEFH